MSLKEIISSIVIMISSLIPTGCMEPTQTQIPEIQLSVSPQTLSMPQGEAQDIFFDVSGTNTTGIKISLITNTPESDDTSRNVSISLIENEAASLISCSNIFGGNPDCTDGTEIEDTFDIKQLGLTLSVPENHPLGSWEMQAVLFARNGDSDDSPNNIVSKSITLNITENTR